MVTIAGVAVAVAKTLIELGAPELQTSPPLPGAWCGLSRCCRSSGVQFCWPLP